MMRRRPRARPSDGVSRTQENVSFGWRFFTLPVAAGGLHAAAVRAGPPPPAAGRGAAAQRAGRLHTALQPDRPLGHAPQRRTAAPRVRPHRLAQHPAALNAAAGVDWLGHDDCCPAASLSPLRSPLPRRRPGLRADRAVPFRAHRAAARPARASGTRLRGGLHRRPRPRGPVRGRRGRGARRHRPHRRGRGDPRPLHSQRQDGRPVRRHGRIADGRAQRVRLEVGPLRPDAQLRPRRPRRHAAGRGPLPGRHARFRRHGGADLPAGRGGPRPACA